MTWIDLSQAARRSGLSTRHLRRLCSTRWKQKNLARPSLRGWQVAESADVRFITFENEIDSTVDLRSVCEQDRQTAFHRLSTLHRWRMFLQTHSQNGFNRNSLTQQFLSTVLENKLSRGTLYRWEKFYHAQGIAGLLPHHTSEKLSINPEAINAFRELYLSPERRSITLCWKIVKELAIKNHWRWFGSVRRCQKWVEANISKPELVLNRHGKKTYDALCAPYIERNPNRFAANECWVGDHHQFDFFCVNRDRVLRPWLTAWQDMRSRMIIGWTISPQPNQYTILNAFRMGCKSEFGLPRHVYIDNGRDYAATIFHGSSRSKIVLRKGYLDEDQLQGLFARLGIDVTFTLPYNPKAKPIERTFRTIEDQFGKTFTTYCGNTPANRSEYLTQHLKQLNNLPTMEMVQKMFSHYLNEVYHLSPHTGKGMTHQSPLEVMRRYQTTKRTADETILDLLLFARPQPIKVGKHGLRFNHLNYGNGDLNLIKWQGKKVRITYDPNDISFVTVWTLDGIFICRAMACVQQGTTDTDLRHALKNFRQIQKSLTQPHRKKKINETTLLSILAAKSETTEAQKSPSVPLNQVPIPTSMKLPASLS